MTDETNENRDEQFNNNNHTIIIGKGSSQYIFKNDVKYEVNCEGSK